MSSSYHGNLFELDARYLSADEKAARAYERSKSISLPYSQYFFTLALKCLLTESFPGLQT